MECSGECMLSRNISLSTYEPAIPPTRQHALSRKPFIKD